MRQNTPKLLYLLFCLFALWACESKKIENQEKLHTKRVDSIPPQNKDILVSDTNYHIKIEPSPLPHKSSKNARLLLIHKDNVLFSDDIISAQPFYFLLKDANNDGQSDVWVRHKIVNENSSYYYLYTVDTLHQTLRKVKGFEKLYQPNIENSYHVIISITLDTVKRQRNYRFYKVDIESKLQALYAMDTICCYDSMMMDIAFQRTLKALKAKP